MNNDEELLIKNIIKDIESIKHTSKCILTHFLTTHEQELITNYIGDSINYKFISGYNTGERKKLQIGNKLSNKINITIFKIEYNTKYYSFEHKDILGSLLNLGFDRKYLGDIIVNNKECFFLIDSSFNDLILNEFKKIKNAPIKCQKTNTINLSNTEKYKEISINTSSLRVDSIVSNITNLSRDKVKDYFKNDYIKINSKVINKIFEKINLNDIISIRKYGRYKINNIKAYISKRKEEKFKLTILKYL